jgi:cysteine synthase
MESETEVKFRGISHLIGNTPLLEIEFMYKGAKRRIFAKAEHMNLTGSIKDRMAFNILKTAYTNGIIKKGYTIIEATSGNTGISFSSIGRALGHKVIIFMPDWMSRERIELIKSMGAQINLVSKEQGGFLGSIEMAETYARDNENCFLPKQFSNSDNITAHYLTTGPEIWWQLRFRSLKPDAFVAGVGTGGTVMGVGKFIKEMHPEVKIHPLEPENSPTLRTGHKIGKHRIQGISDEFIPAIVDLNYLDEIVDVDDGDAIIMAQKIADELGLGVGISSGANFVGALKIQNMLGPDSVVVTVFCDDNKKYLSTDLLKKEEIKNGFLSPDVKLTGFNALKRVCHTCCDPVNCLEAVCDTCEELVMPDCPRRIRQIGSGPDIK